MVKKFKLCAIGNHEKFNYYIFEKKQEVIIAVANLISGLLGSSDLPLFRDYQDKNKKWRMKKINYEKKKDFHEGFLSDKGRADIYFGDKKIFVTFLCSNRLRLKFNESLEPITYMPKPKKFKENGKIFRPNQKK